MKILTGNDLKTGEVIWWTGYDWSLHVEEAADVGDQGDAILAREEGARRVNASYVIDAEADPMAASAPPISRTASARSARPCAPT